MENKLKNTNKQNIYYTNSLNFDFNTLEENITEIHYNNNTYIEIDGEEINKFIEKLKNYNNNIKLVLRISYDLYDREELEKIKYKDLVEFKSEQDLNRLKVDDLINVDKLLDLFIEDIKISDLSPFEKYTAAYNIVKSFKQYNMFMNDKYLDQKISDQSRSLYLILLNDYIVCCGYTVFLSTLLYKLNIRSLSFGDDKHQINLTNIVDPKYNINGYYFSDVTTENYYYYKMGNLNQLNKTVNYFSHITYDRCMNKYSELLNNQKTISEPMNMKDDNEMLEYLNKNIETNFKGIDNIKDTIYILDPEYYEKIKNKKANLEFAHEINEYFKSKNNKPISADVDFNVMAELDKFVNNAIYNKQELEKLKKEIVTNSVEYAAYQAINKSPHK